MTSLFNVAVSNLNVNETNTREIDTYVSNLAAKYNNALQNYKKNTGKEHPLAIKTNDKRDETSVDLKPVGGGGAWIGPITVGGQEFLIDFDTGSPDLIVNHGAYDPSKSNTAVNTHKHFKQSYGDGTHGDGTVYRDSLKLGDATAKSVSVGLTNQQMIDPSHTGGNQGIAGMSFTSISGFRAQDKNAMSIYEALRKSHSIPHNVYQFTLTTGDGSQLHVGGVDKSKISSDVTYVNVNPDQGFWVTSAKISGVGFRAVIDSGTTIIIGVHDQVKQLFKKIDGVEPLQKGDMLYGVYDCDRDLGIALNIGGKDFRIPKEVQKLGGAGDGRCILSIAGASHQLPLNAWIVGDTLFRGHSIIFDVDNHRIGFATAA